LATDALSPQYYFLLPTGKIRDSSFVYHVEGESVPSILFMASSGYIYTQTMEEASSARHGPFYVTNVLDVTHEDVAESASPTSQSSSSSG
jgi:E3 ubiquitin-protein ligase UBR4